MEHRGSTLTGAYAQRVMHAGESMTAMVAAPGSILAASGDPGTTGSAPGHRRRTGPTGTTSPAPATHTTIRLAVCRR
jgi:hypothetical protein